MTNAQSKNKRSRNLSDIEQLESRAYLSGVAFAGPVNLAASTVGITPVSASLADFSGDGDADLVVTNSDDSVSVLMSNGNGSFATPVTLPVVGTPNAITTGHFDTTGNLDLAVGTSGSPGSVSIILGNGDGTFLQANDIAALDDNHAIAVGDFNNDGHADILTVSSSASPSGNAMLLLGNGTAGAFAQSPFNLPFGTVSAVAVGDFNGDGNLDFAVTNSLNNSVSVLLGNGDGTFQSPATYATGAGPSSIAVADVTGKTLSNGKPELDILVGNATDGTLSYLANNGDGTFESATSTAVGTNVTGISVADFNKDGRPDVLALLGAGSGNDAEILLGNGDGTFVASNTIATNLGTRTGAAAGDLNGDGYPDVVLTNTAQVTSLLNAFSVGSTTSITTLTVTSASITAGETDTFTASIAPSGATGSVNFLANGVSIGTANVVNGSAALTTKLNSAGDLAITALYSGDGNDAQSVSAATTVTVASAVVLQTLVPVIVRSTLPAAVVSGYKAKGTATVEITNNTADTVSGAVTVNLYATTTGIVDAKSILIGTLKKTKITIKAGKGFSASVSIKLSADMLAVGSYKLLAQTVDPSGNLTTSASGVSLIVSAPFLALSETYTRLVLPASAVGGIKTSLVAQIRITNSGNIISSGVTPVNLYLSPDGTVASGTLVNTIRKGLTIGVEKSVLLTIPLKAFPVTTAGSYSLVAEVTDPLAGTSLVVSTSPVNLQAPTIDFAGHIDTAPTTGAIGKTISVTLEIANNGNVLAQGPLVIAFTGSAASDGSSPFVLSTVKTTINIKPLKTQKVHVKVLVPLNTVAGNSYLIATIDPANAYSDPNETDNTVISLLPIAFG